MVRDVLTRRSHRHDFGWLPGRDLQVPLLTDGEVHRGFFRVPAASVTFKEHSNEVLRYDRVVVQKVREWLHWKAKHGWHMRGRPTVYAPVPEPTERTGDEVNEDELRVYVDATFYRTVPMHVGLETFLERMEEHKRYQVPVADRRQLTNRLPDPVDHIADGEAGNPMEAAHERREDLGLRRELEVQDGVVVNARIIRGSIPERGDE